MEAVLNAINNNVDNVEASALNVVVAKEKGNGVLADSELEIRTMKPVRANTLILESLHRVPLNR